MLLLCSRGGNVVILNVLRQVSILCYFCLFLSCVLGVFKSLVPTPAHGLLGHIPSFRLRFTLEKASLRHSSLYICAAIHGPTSLSC